VEKQGSRFVDYGFFAFLLLAGYLFYQTLERVLVPLVLGAFAAVLSRPTHASLAQRFPRHPRVAGALTTGLVVLLVLLPAVFLIVVLLQELVHVVERGAAVVDTHGLEGLLAKAHVPRRIRSHIAPEQLNQLAAAATTKVGTLMTHAVTAALELFVGLFLCVIALYYFLIDGPRWLDELARIMPMRARYVRAFAREFNAVSHALFYGSMVTALVQGAVASIGYVVFGVPQPLLWGAATALLSVTPIVGTTIVWGPIGAVLIASDHVTSGVGVLVWNALITGTVDNFLRPLLMRGHMGLHPLMVFLSLIGGVAAFGMVGLLFGPLAAAIFLVAVRIYDRDYRQRLDPDPSG